FEHITKLLAITIPLSSKTYADIWPTKSIRGKQTETVVVDEVEEEDDDEFYDDQVVEETEQRNNLRNSMEISNEQSSPPTFSRNRAVSPDKRNGSTTDVRPAKKRSSSRKRTVVK
ncbi:unnamed protein product, partial [Didymodactylos carnosus]